MKTLYLLPLIIIFSCNPYAPYNMPDSTYPQLKGSYTHSSYESWSGGLYERRVYQSYDFDSTAVAWYYSCNWSYTTSGWNNALKDGTSYDMEWEVSGSTFKERLYDNEFSSWKSYGFTWVDSSTVIIDGLTYTKD